MIKYILEFVSYKEYEKYLFINVRILKAIHFILSSKPTKALRRNLKSKAYSVFFNYSIYRYFNKRINPYLNSVEGFRKILEFNCRVVLMFCLEIKSYVSTENDDPFEKILEFIAIRFNYFLESTLVKSLDLSNLIIGKNGSLIISFLIVTNTSLNLIDLRNNEILYDEVYVLFGKFKRNKQYLTIDMRGNNLDLKSISSISNVLKDDVYKSIYVSKIPWKLPKNSKSWSIIEK